MQLATGLPELTSVNGGAPVVPASGLKLTPRSKLTLVPTGTVNGEVVPGEVKFSVVTTSALLAAFAKTSAATIGIDARRRSTHGTSNLNRIGNIDVSTGNLETRGGLG
ncbi:MAG TPA: hypothetical protein VMS01_09010 [Stellaceae bacterium]|nr:hypothetical protein [Stellaceae bacterium]